MKEFPSISLKNFQILAASPWLPARNLLQLQGKPPANKSGTGTHKKEH
jgi:hypothetical protein